MRFWAEMRGRGAEEAGRSPLPPRAACIGSALARSAALRARLRRRRRRGGGSSPVLPARPQRRAGTHHEAQDGEPVEPHHLHLVAEVALDELHLGGGPQTFV